jgi:hypothetical protein
LTFSYHHVWFSQNARGYTGLLFFTLLSSYWFVRSLREGTRTTWLMHGVSLALGVYMHLTAAYVVAAQGIIYLGLFATGLNRNRRHAMAVFAGFVWAGLLTLIFYAPILPQVFSFFVLRKRPPVAAPAEWTNPLWLILEAARSLGLGLPAGLAALAAGGVIVLVGLVSYWHKERLVVWLTILPAGIGGTVMLGLGRNLWPRSFFFLAGFGVMVVVRAVFAVSANAAGLVDRARPDVLGRRLALVVLAVLTFASATMLRRNYALPKQDYVGALNYVEAIRKPGEPVLTVGLASFPYRDYYPTDFLPVASVDELNRNLAHHSGYVLYTFPIHLRSRYPDIWTALAARGTEIRRFAGTVGDGDIVVLRVAG